MAVSSIKGRVLPGDTVDLVVEHQMTVALDMNDLYERAFFRGLLDHVSTAAPKPTWKLQVLKPAAMDTRL